MTWVSAQCCAAPVAKGQMVSESLHLLLKMMFLCLSCHSCLVFASSKKEEKKEREKSVRIKHL